ncbi:MAG: ABC transporter substrate-binding protein, partial [Anaerolineae bacterium]
MPILRLRLLGGLDLSSDGKQLPNPPTLKSQSLLAYLALHRSRPQSREHLAGMFWGERPERKARRSLTTALWHIRRCLPDEETLLSNPHTVQFDPQTDLWIDVEAFEAHAAYDDLTHLTSALALYTGDFLEGFYDDWIITVRYRLETLLCDLLVRLMLIQEAADDQEAALSTALRLLNRDPLQEVAHRLAMRALCRLGQRGAALEQYRRCQETIQQELGTGPMVETQELYQAIVEGRFEMGPPPAAPVAAEIFSAILAGYDPLEAPVHDLLVGREPEIAFLQDSYQAAQQGQGGMVLVSGEAGVGKTSLVEAFSRRLRWQGACVLWGRCYEFERVLPYQPVAEALRAVVPAMTRAELEDYPTWVLVEIARLIPEIQEKLPELDVIPAIRSEQQRMRLFEGVSRFLTHLSNQSRLLIVLEDLHWATESTLQLIHYLVRHLAAHAVLILGTLRPEAVSQRHPLRDLRHDLAREGLARPLSLGPLSLESVGTLVTRMSGAGDAALPLARRLYEETEGNPFFLMESVRALFEAGWLSLREGRWEGDLIGISLAELPLPLGVSETIEARVRGLDDVVQEAVRLATVLGREFDLDVLDAVWGRGEGSTLEALDQLLRRRLVEEGSGALARDYAFTHHKIQEVIYASIPQRHRQWMHARAGLAMERLCGSKMDELTGEVAGELAYHFHEGAHYDEDLREKAASYSLQAGDRARFAYAYQEAADYYEQALGWLKLQQEHELAGRTLMKLGLTYQGNLDFERAREAYDEGFLSWQRAGRRGAARRIPAPHPLRSWQAEPATLDPSIVTDWSSGVVMEQLFSSLVRFGPDMEVLPEAATGWEITAGGRTYTFHLRRDARWSDGAPVTTRDFEYAWQRMLDPSRIVGPGSSFYNVRGARAYQQGAATDPNTIAVHGLEEHTLRIELEHPDRNFLYLTLYAIPIPRHLVEALGEAWTEPGQMVSNGPFQLESWRRGESMVLARNPEYQGRREGNLERIELSFVHHDAALEAYAADALDVLSLDYAPPAALQRMRYRHPDEYVSIPDLSTYYLRYDLGRPPFNDRRVRRAFAMATDRSKLPDVMLGGLVFPATGGLVPISMPGHSPGIALPYDPLGAQKQLAEAGYPRGAGFPTVTVLWGQGREAIIDDLSTQWRDTLQV